MPIALQTIFCWISIPDKSLNSLGTWFGNENYYKSKVVKI